MNARAEVRYRVTVAPSRTQSGVLEYDLARMVRAGDLLPGHLAELAGVDEIVPEPLAHLTTPLCDRRTSEHVVGAWLFGQEPGDYTLTYDWRDEPIIPVRESSGIGGRYAERGRRSWWKRLRPNAA